MAQVMMKALNKKYDEVHAVKDVNLHIRDKEFMVLVGPSGCGKSTTLRMVAGLEEITSGEIHIGDRLVNDLPPKDRDIAMVFQNYALYPHMTVYDNMAFGLKMRKFPKAEIEKRVKEAADILGIQELLKRKPRQLSGGQRQRVAVGRAIVRHPQVFLSSPERKTVPVGVVSELIRGDIYFWGQLMAGALLGSVPVALVYSFFVEYYVTGLTGSVKG
jgi:multiple sugar transport system ATP-binding protein